MVDVKLVLKNTAKTAVTALALAGAWGAWQVNKILKTTPTITKQTLRSSASSNMYASDGSIIWSSETNKRIYVKYKDIPKQYINLLLSTEDRTYWKDSGVSVKGLTNAVISYVGSKFGVMEARGGSSIEQQLIKLSVFSTSEKDRTIARKLKEMFLAQQLDQNFGKEKILELYANKIYMGEGSYGIQTIAHTYWGKSLKDLDLSQLAIIAGVSQAGSYYNLYDRPKAVEARRNQILANARATGVITHQEYIDAKNESVTKGLKKRYWSQTKIAKTSTKYASFISSALNEVANNSYNIVTTPLQIHTSLDRRRQDAVQKAFNNPAYFQSSKQQAAITVSNPKTGKVLVQLGGRGKQSVTGFNRATSTQRSTGSSIKPIVDYGPAFEYLNYSTNTILNSGAYHYAGTNITATNWGGYSYGMVTVQRALTESMNTPAIRTLDVVGPTRAAIFAKKLGITQKAPLAGSSALGVDASTAQMSAAYGAFSNYGIYRKASYIDSLVFPDRSVKKIKDKGKRAMSEATAYIMTKMLRQVLTASAGTLHAGYVRGINMSAKTGTVAYPNGANVPDDSAMDFWTCGYTKDLSIALWEGFDSPMAKNSYLRENETINKRGQLWKYLTIKLTKGRDNSSWKKPSGVATNYGGGLYVAHKTKLKTISGIDTPQSAVGNSPYFTATKAKKNKQSEYQIPKNYNFGYWQKKASKESSKQSKEDNKLYGEDNTGPSSSSSSSSNAKKKSN